MPGLIDKFLPEHFFWDIDPSRINPELNKRIIIERVLMLGNKYQIKELIHYYGLDTIRVEIVNAGNLDPKTLNWLSIILNIPKNKFKCYIKRQSTKTYWNF
jgi:hypothetical protein